LVVPQLMAGKRGKGIRIVDESTIAVKSNATGVKDLSPPAV